MKWLLSTLSITVLLATACSVLKARNHPPGLPLCYHNSKYDFTFYLPGSWQGYSALIREWVPSHSETPARGPMIVLRHPLWKTNSPCQDIRILVFTRSQWEADKQGKLSYGAGGAEGEVAHNSKYVFATWTRFCMEELKGWKEVEDIVSLNGTANAPHLQPE